jgi:hypothetical protein
MEWIVSNTKGLEEHGDIQRLKMDVESALDKMEQQWSLCGIKCSRYKIKCTNIYC